MITTVSVAEIPQMPEWYLSQTGKAKKEGLFAKELLTTTTTTKWAWKNLLKIDFLNSREKQRVRDRQSQIEEQSSSVLVLPDIASWHHCPTQASLTASSPGIACTWPTKGSGREQAGALGSACVIPGAFLPHRLQCGHMYSWRIHNSRRRGMQEGACAPDPHEWWGMCM